MQEECNLDDKSNYQGNSDITDEVIERRLDKLKGLESKNSSGKCNNVFSFLFLVF